MIEILGCNADTLLIAYCFNCIDILILVWAFYVLVFYLIT